MIKGILIILLQITVFVASPCNGAELTPFDNDLFCKFASKFVPGLKWREVHPGAQLYAFDALLICSASTARIKSNLSFGNVLLWKQQESGSKIADIAPETLIVIFTSPKNQGAIAVEVLEVDGNVFYSTDHELIKTSGIVGGQSRPR